LHEINGSRSLLFKLIAFFENTGIGVIFQPMFRLVLIYGSLLAAILILLKMLEFTLVSYRIGIELYIGVIALFFFIGGGAIGYIINKKKREREQLKYQADQNSAILSQREKEVLEYLANGFTNQEIAEKLFVSLNTVKTHINNIYQKLDVNKRTKAILKAKELGVIK
jgi:two-component system, NarL family, response regulator LiaR